MCEIKDKILIRNFPDGVLSMLQESAKKNERSLEAEARFAIKVYVEKSTNNAEIQSKVVGEDFQQIVKTLTADELKLITLFRANDNVLQKATFRLLIGNTSKEGWHENIRGPEYYK